ncbi:HWE histidine kinase domain-containing protein [Agrobacterium sp.]|uniref:HWE histidine kinase domain-containing protein n=1 Tax=Agrobacterium sp. TaxID=361 RepID=UPI0028A6C098|nr:HWE histidine kinase domain-containing protein [Agrobacterium sp.]
MNIPDKQVNLTNCDKEPIHIPGYIQPHGCLIACDKAMHTVIRHSENCAEMLQEDEHLHGRQIESILGEQAVHDLRNALTIMNRSERPAVLPGVRIKDDLVFDIAVHRHKSTTIIELEPSSREVYPLHIAQRMIERIKSLNSIDVFVERTAKLVKATLGYDRVMIYRFEEDGAGKVISEAKERELESFLGQYFPASDIPQQARALYLKNTLRIISNARGERVAINPVLDASGEPLDLSFAHLRSVSPIHLEYLRNMGVSASMSISIIVDGVLWGLIACHHYSPRMLSMPERLAAEMFGEFFSLHLQALKQKRKLDTANQAHAALDTFLRIAAHHTDIEQLLVESFHDFTRLMPCDGVGLWLNGKWYGYGSTPPEEAIPALVMFTTSMVESAKIWAGHSLTQQHPEAASYSSLAAGMLAIPLSQVEEKYLLFFRKELIQTLNWAGNPEKSYETGPMGDRLTPRKSFAIWKETVEMQAQPWTEADRQIAEAARVALMEIAFHHSELMAGERKRAEVRQRMLNEELNHRVKNVLAIIKSIVGNPKQQGRTLEDYITSLKGRIQALSFAHDQIIRGDGGGALKDLLDAELTPHKAGEGTITLDGPNVVLDSRAFSVMALVLHELATNAAKYGALAHNGGHLTVSWKLNEVGDCALDWRETLRSSLVPPSRTGFGTALINRSIPYDLGGKSTTTYLLDGLQVQMLLPARHVSSSSSVAPSTIDHNTVTPSHHHEKGEPLKVLLVEDQMLIAMDVENMLEDNGIFGVETATSSGMALEKLKSFSPDIAILDINLGSDTSIPVAQELLKRDIPFMFATGYSDSLSVPVELTNVPVIRKPYDEDALMSAIGRLAPKRESA